MNLVVVKDAVTEIEHLAIRYEREAAAHAEYAAAKDDEAAQHRKLGAQAAESARALRAHLETLPAVDA